MTLPWEIKGCFPFFVEEMEKRLKTPLAQQFPTLTFARKADKWLASIKNKSIEKQFAERRIVKIGFDFLSDGEGFLSLAKDGDGIYIYINSESKERLQTLAHEIGHTFHLDLTKTPIENTIPDEWEYHEENLEYCLIEDFAETFGEKWLAINGKEKIEEWRQRRNKEVQLREQR